MAFKQSDRLVVGKFKSLLLSTFMPQFYMRLIIMSEGVWGDSFRNSYFERNLTIVYASLYVNYIIIHVFIFINTQ